MLEFYLCVGARSGNRREQLVCNIKRKQLVCKVYPWTARGTTWLRMFSQAGSNPIAAESPERVMPSDRKG